MIKIDCNIKEVKFIRPFGKKHYRHNRVPSCFVDAISKCEVGEHIEITQFNGKVKTFKRIENLDKGENK